MKTGLPEKTSLRFTEHACYLHACVSGELESLAVSIEFWRLCIEECKQRGFRKLLVEENFPNQLSTHEIYTLVGAIRKMIDSPMKIAFVDAASDQAELNMFGETVATNRGITGKVFNDLEAARNWLKPDLSKLDWDL